MDNNNSLKILLIEDEETCVLGVKILLQDTKYNLVVAKNGALALKILQKQSINLILLDLMLPDIHGLELLKQIKEDRNLCKIPVILQTGSSNWEHINTAKNLGIVGLIRKPYQKNSLLKIINQSICTI